MLSVRLAAMKIYYSRLVGLNVSACKWTCAVLLYKTAFGRRTQLIFGDCGRSLFSNRTLFSAFPKIGEVQNKEGSRGEERRSSKDCPGADVLSSLSSESVLKFDTGGRALAGWAVFGSAESEVLTCAFAPKPSDRLCFCK